jgi:toxin ParE1/3/4
VKSVTVAPRARRDLQETWIYSRDHWGVRRANSYLREFDAVIQQVGDTPMLGQTCDEVRPGYRKHPAGSHMLFYEIRDDAVVIVRVLHQRMDVEGKL